MFTFRFNFILTWPLTFRDSIFLSSLKISHECGLVSLQSRVTWVSVCGRLRVRSMSNTGGGRRRFGVRWASEACWVVQSGGRLTWWLVTSHCGTLTLEMMTLMVWDPRSEHLWPFFYCWENDNKQKKWSVWKLIKLNADSCCVIAFILI